LVTFGLLGTLTFLGLFFYFSGLPPAHSAGEADAFTTQNQPHQSRPQKRQGIFGRKSINCFFIFVVL